MSDDGDRWQWRKTEFVVALAGIAASLGTAVLDSGLVSEDSKIYAIISIMVLVATYVASRAWVKASRSKGERKPADDAASIRTRLEARTRADNLD